MISYFQNEFLEYPSLLRHAVSLGRRIQDPLSEFAALCVEEDELLCLRLHPLQVWPGPPDDKCRIDIVCFIISLILGWRSLQVLTENC